MKPLPIRDDLLLGDANTATRKLAEVLDEPWCVRAIVSVGGGDNSALVPATVKYLHIGVLDKGGDGSVAKMTGAMLDAVTFIRAAQAEGRTVLVHCRGGISRSPAVVCAALMANEGLSWDDALEAVRAHRKVRPRPEFEEAANAAVAEWRKSSDGGHAGGGDGGGGHFSGGGGDSLSAHKGGDGSDIDFSGKGGGGSGSGAGDSVSAASAGAGALGAGSDAVDSRHSRAHGRGRGSRKNRDKRSRKPGRARHGT